MASYQFARIFRRTRRFLLIVPKFITGFICLYILFPIFSLSILPIVFYRWVLIRYAKYFRPDLEKMVNAKGTMGMFEDVYVSPKAKLVTGVVLEGCPSYDDIVEGLESAMSTIDPSNGELLYPELKQEVVTWMGYRFFKPIKNFKTEEHFNYMHGTTYNFEQVMQLLKNESMIPFPKGKAVWNLILVPNYIAEESAPYYQKDKKYSFLLYTIHHGLSDGFSVVKLAHKVLQVKYVSANADPAEPPASFCQKFGRSIAIAFKMPFDVGDYIFSVSMTAGIWKWKNIDSSQDKKGKGKDEEDAGKSKEPKIKYNYCYSFSELIPFSKVVEVRKKHGVGSLAVTFAALIGAIRTIMFKSEKNIPHKLNAVIPTPIPNHPDRLRNHMTGISPALTIREPDPVKRLHKIHRCLKRYKRSTLPWLHIHLGSFMGCLPPSIIQILFKLAAKNHFLGLSSFPGTKYEIPLFKDCVWKENFWISSITTETKGLAFAFTTYNGYARLLAIADESVASNEETQALCKEFINHLELLKIAKTQETV